MGFALVPSTEPELALLHRWLDNWRGVGDVVRGMNRQGYWLHLSNIDAGTWRATFARRDDLGRRVRCGLDAVAGGAKGGVTTLKKYEELEHR